VSGRFVALLRGVNVGGRNAVAMADLRAAFDGAGYSAVSTYIQSGNVLFTSDAPRAITEDRLESLLEHRFGVPLVVVVRSYRQFRDIVGNAPERIRNAARDLPLRRHLLEASADGATGHAGHRLS
jgi:uncharacterized protein (DUF1697 family)